MERTFAERGMSGFLLHDPLAVAVALDPSLVAGKRRRVTVDVQDSQRGKTVVEAAGTGPMVATDVDALRFVTDLATSLGLPAVHDLGGLDRAE